MIRASPRSTVIRLVAPRNVVAITVPTSGPESSAVSGGERDGLRPDERGRGPVRRGRVDQGQRQPAHADAAVAHLAVEAVRQTHELRDERRLGPGIDVGRRTELLQAAILHHADAVGDRQRLLLVVGDEQCRDPDLQLDPADLVAQLGAHLRVERRQRLVQQEHLRPDRERPGQRDALLLSARDLVRVAVRLRREPTSSSISSAR